MHRSRNFPPTRPSRVLKLRGPRQCRQMRVDAAQRQCTTTTLACCFSLGQLRDSVRQWTCAGNYIHLVFRPAYCPPTASGLHPSSLVLPYLITLLQGGLTCRELRVSVQALSLTTPCHLEAWRCCSRLRQASTWRQPTVATDDLSEKS